MVRIENVIERMETFLSINTTHMPQCNETYEPHWNTYFKVEPLFFMFTTH
jgi:hypothetical protein